MVEEEEEENMGWQEQDWKTAIICVETERERQHDRSTLIYS